MPTRPARLLAGGLQSRGGAGVRCGTGLSHYPGTRTRRALTSQAQPCERGETAPLVTAAGQAGLPGPGAVAAAGTTAAYSDRAPAPANIWNTPPLTGSMYSWRLVRAA